MIMNIQYHPFYIVALVFLIFMAGSFSFCYGFLSGSMSSDKISEKGNPYVKEMIFKNDQQKAIYQRQWFPTQANQTIFIFEDSLAFYLAVDEYIQQQYKLDQKSDQKESKDTNKTKYSQNVLFKEMLNRVTTEASNSLLFKSYAHPPTYTATRVQAVLQGNLPSYLSISSNMGSKKLRQDNIVYQAKYNNPFLGIDESRKKVLFYGDFIWSNFFGDLFDRSRYMSVTNFHQREKQDLEMYELIEAEQMRNNDWSTLFVHFNGIDDASHSSNSMYDSYFQNTLSVESDLLGKILNNTNESTLNNDQAVIVVSDHGLDYNAYAHHGGYTANETNTLVFGYSKKGFIQKEQKDIGQMMDKEYLSNPAIFSIHATPTFCMMQGVPIPSNNLGMIIPDFFINSPDVDDFVIANNYYTNFRQIEDRFLEACSQVTGGIYDAENINLFASEIKDQYKQLFVNVNSTGMIQAHALKNFVESCIQFSVNVVETIQKEVKDPQLLFMYQGLIIHLLAAVLALIFLIILKRASNNVQGMFYFIVNLNVFIKKIRLVLIASLIIYGTFYFVLRVKLFLSFQLALIIFVFSQAAYQSLCLFKVNSYNSIIMQQYEPKNKSIIDRIIYYLDIIFFLGSQIFFTVTRTSNDYFRISYDYYLGYLEYYCLFLLFFVVLRFKLKQVLNTLLLISKIVSIPALLYFIGLYCTRIHKNMKRINRETRQIIADSYFFSITLPLCVFSTFFMYINYQIFKSIRSKCSFRYKLFFLYQSIVQIGSVLVFYYCIFNKIYFNQVIKICPAISLFHMILGEMVKYIYLKKNSIHFSQNWKIFTSSMSFTLGIMYTLEANSLVQLPIFFVIIYLVCSVCISLKTVSQMNIFLFLFFISQHLFFAGGHIELFSELHIEVLEYMSVFKGFVIPIFNGIMNTYFYLLITIVLLPIIISLSKFDSVDRYSTPDSILNYILDINQETQVKIDKLNNVQKQTEKGQDIEITQINQDSQSLILQTEENKINQTQQSFKYSFYCLIFISPIITGFNGADIRNISRPFDSWKEQEYMPSYLFQLIFITLYFLTMLLGICYTRTKN